MKKMAVIPVAFAMALALGCNRPTTTSEENARDLDNAPAIPDAIGTVGADNNREFLTRALDANMAEIELGRMAEERATHPVVKGFGHLMVTDHSKALDALKPIANRQGTPMVGQLSDEHRELRDRLATLRGEQFDREYMRAMVDGHEKVVDLLQTRANEHRFGADKGTAEPEKTADPIGMEINQWAAKTLPTTRHHLDEAKRIHGELR